MTWDGLRNSKGQARPYGVYMLCRIAFGAAQMTRCLSQGGHSRHLAWIGVFLHFWAETVAHAQAVQTSGQKPRVISHSRILRKHQMRPLQATMPQSMLKPWVYIPQFSQESALVWVASGGDVTGDGLADLILGEAGFDQGLGRILIYNGSNTGLGPSPSMVLTGSHSRASLGHWVQIVGDINGDGIDDLMFSENTGGEGLSPTSGKKRILLLFGASLGKPPIPMELTSTCIGAGDLNGDGFDDVALFDGDSKVHAYYGSPSGFRPEPDWTARSEQPGSDFGARVSAAGDVNGDGWDDLLISAPKFSGKLLRSGKVYLYLGSASGLRPAPDWSAEYDQPITPGLDDPHEQQFGFDLSGAGDVNGDGYNDILVGARFAERGDRNEGLALLFLGSRTGPGPHPDWVAESNQPHSLFGYGVACAHDLNGDGFEDVIIGAPQLNDGQLGEGAVVAYHGSANGLGRSPVWSMESDHSNEQFGWPISSAGDINGDGYADVLLVGKNYGESRQEGYVKLGRAVVVYGGPGGLPVSHHLSFEKPVLLGLHQILDRYYQRFGRIVYWGPVSVGFAFVTGALLLVIQRLRLKVAQLSEERRGEIRDEERTRIMRDVHDALGADVSQIIADVREAKAALAGNPEAVRVLEKVSESTNETADTMDELVWVLNPAMDTLSSFVANGGEYAVRYLSAHQIECSLDFPETTLEIGVSATARHALHMVLREALRNVVKHAAASRVEIHIKIENDLIELTIQDDGRGISSTGDRSNGDMSTPGRIQGGVGLSSMRARMTALRGTVDVESQPGRGTVVRIRLPRTTV